MKTHIVSMLAAAALMSGAAYAEETLPEKAKATGNDVKRSGRKTGHRVEEALCTGTKAQCEKEKLKNRVQEGSDKVKDEAKELKEKVD